MMPGETGLELARDLKSMSPIPICMLTALADAEQRVAGLEAGVDDYLAKPFEPRELLLRVQQHPAPRQAAAARPQTKCAWASTASTSAAAN